MGFSLNDILNDASKKQGTGKREGFKVTAIQLDKIIPAENNFYDTSEIEELAASIEASGLLHNIVVQAANEEGLYRIVSGERRYRAYKLLYEDGNEKYSAIPAIIKTYESEEDAELDLIFSNSTARELSDYEKTQQASRIRELLQKKKEKGHKFEGRMREIVAKILNVSTSQVQRMEQIDRHLTPEFKGEFAAGNIGVTDAFELSRKPEEEQVAAYEKFKETGTIKKPEDRIPNPVSQEDIDKALIRTDYYDEWRGKVIEFFRSNASAAEKADYLRKAFCGSAGYTGYSFENGFVENTTKGMRISTDSYEKVTTLTWAKARARIEELIEEGRFTSTTCIAESKPDKHTAVADHKPEVVAARLDRGIVKRRLLHIAETIETTGGHNLSDKFWIDVKETCIAAAELIDQA